MQLEDMILVSVDDHIIEPAHMFERHLDSRWQQRAPRLGVDPKTGVQTWSWEAGASAAPFLNAVVTLPNEEWGMDPVSQAEVRPGCYDVQQRLKDMDANGVLASLCFPTFATFSGNFFAQCKDRALALACLQAYNDWHIDEWCASAPGRFIPLAMPALWDPELAAREVRRAARKGARAVGFTEDTEGLGLPSIHGGAWDPFFAACVDEGVSLAIHIGSGKFPPPGLAPDTPLDAILTMPNWGSLTCAIQWITSPVLQRFPDLRIALSEGGTSWIPGFLDRMERHHGNQRWTGWDLEGQTPTEAFRRHFLACFICDPSGLLLRDRIGIENIAFETDYPHSDCSWPKSPEELWEHAVAAECSDTEIAKITHENALRWFHHDPFAQIPRAEATVGALRSRAADVDLGMRSKAWYREQYEAAAARA